MRAPKRDARREVALGALCGVLFLTFLDNTIVSVALADMQQSLRSGVSSLQWIVDGYMLAFAGLMLTGGTLGDLFGRKRVLLVGVAIFCGGSVVAATAGTSKMLIAGRVIMGVGAAACEPGTLSLIRQLYREDRLRARALGIWTAVSAISLAAGPVVGGLILHLASWRWIFWFNLAFGAVAFVVAWWTLPESSDRAGRSLDVPGLVIGATSVTALTFGIIEGESSGFRTWWIIVLFGVAAGTAGLFVRLERRRTDPVLQLSFFRNRTFSCATAVGFATSFGLFAVFFFSALYLQVVADFSTKRIALAFVPMAIAMITAGVASGAWTAERGPRVPMALGCALSGGAILVVDRLLDPKIAFWSLAATLAVVGFGLGLALVAVTASVLAIVPAERSGMAASTVNTSRQLGGVLAVAILGAVINNRLVAELSSRLTGLGVPNDLRELVIAGATHGGLPADAQLAIATSPIVAAHPEMIGTILDAAKTAFGHGLHSGLTVAAAVLFAATVVSLTTPRAPSV